MTIASIALGLIVLARREPLPTRRELPAIAFVGVFWFALYNIALMEGERRVDAGTAAMLVNVGPIFIPLLAGIFLREGFPPRLLAGCAVAFVGAVVIGSATSKHGTTEAGKSVFGRWVASRVTPPGQPIGWAVRTDDIDDVGRRLGLTVRAGSRVTPTGGRLEWRAAGMEEAAADGSLPFFIEWGSGTPFPGHALVKHPGGTPAITQILTRGDAGRLGYWLDGHALPAGVSRGAPMLAGIVLSRADSKIVLMAGERAIDRRSTS